MSPEPEKHVDLSHQDNDPRKSFYISRLLRAHPEIIRIWRDFGITRRVPHPDKEGLTKRKHLVPRHLAAAIMAADALGGMLVDSDLIASGGLDRLVLAAGIHDASKDVETPLIIAARAADTTWEQLQAIIDRQVQFAGKDRIVAQLKLDYESYFRPQTAEGVRIFIARDKVSGGIHDARLEAAGISHGVVELQALVEYSSCPETEALLDRFDQLTGEQRQRAIEMLAMHWIDDSLRNDELVPIQQRLEEVFQKPVNIPLSEVYRQFNSGGESSKDIQIRVGHLVQAKLAQLLGIEPDQLLEAVLGRMQQNIVPPAPESI